MYKRGKSQHAQRAAVFCHVMMPNACRCSRSLARMLRCAMTNRSSQPERSGTATHRLASATAYVPSRCQHAYRGVQSSWYGLHMRQLNQQKIYPYHTPGGDLPRCKAAAAARSPAQGCSASRRRFSAAAICASRIVSFFTIP